MVCRTIQRFHQTPFASVESRDSHVSGWNECFDREQAYVKKLARANRAVTESGIEVGG